MGRQAGALNNAAPGGHRKGDAFRASPGPFEATSNEGRCDMATMKESSTKAAVLKLLAEGKITKTEAAQLAGVSRQTMNYWTRDIDVEAARAACLARIWTKAREAR